MFKNPLVNLWFFLSLILSLLAVSSQILWMIHAILFFIILIKNRDLTKFVFKRTLPFVLSFPIMIAFYIGFSLWLTDTTPVEIFLEGGVGFLKLMMMVIIMSIFFESTPSQDILTVLRSLWVRVNIPWRFVEDFFLFLGLTLRFYPSFQSDWNTLKNSRRALGFVQKESIFGKIRTAVNDLPGLLLYHLRKSEEVALVMKLRGYGKQFPRSVIDPIAFTKFNLIQLVMITLMFFGIHHYASF